MRSRFSYSWLMLILGCLALHGSENQPHASQMSTVDSLIVLEQEIPNLDENSLIIFDRDDTLLQGIDTMEPALRKNFVELWKQIFLTTKTAAEKNELYAIIRIIKPTLIEPFTP